jgi:hypothetical protein
MSLNEQSNTDLKVVAFFLATILIVALLATSNACAPPVDAVCGNGIVETGEKCDPPDGTTCDESCQTIGTDEISIYLNSLPSWSTFAPQSPSTEPAPLDEDDSESSVEVVDDVTYDCTTTRYTVTDNPEKIVMYSPDVEILWPGALIQGESYRDADGPGSLRGLVIAERTPIRVSIPSLAGEDNFREVASPNQANVSQAIGSMIGNATIDDLPEGSDILFKQEVCHSEQQFALAMSVSGRFLGFSAATGADFRRNASETTVAVHLIEKMYEVVVEPPQTPGAFFGPDFTQEKLDEQIALGRIGADNLPVYVSNVTYGRMMTFTLTSTASEQQIKAASNAGYRGIVSRDVEGEYQKILQESRIQVTSLGGDANATLGMIADGEWWRYFTDSAPLSTARPLSYTFRNLGDGSIASVTEATEYNVKECSAGGPPLENVEYFDNQQDFRARVEEQGGEVKEFDTSAANIGLAIGYTPQNDWAIGSQLYFGGDRTGFAFDFWLENLTLMPFSGDKHRRGLVFNDEGFSSYTNWEYISIGRNGWGGDYSNDDFEIRVRANEGSEVFAIGIFVDANHQSAGEKLTVKNEQDVESVFTENMPSSGMTSTGVFMGVVSPEPLKSIRFDEDPGDNDIRVKNFRFGVR